MKTELYRNEDGVISFLIEPKMQLNQDGWIHLYWPDGNIFARFEDRGIPTQAVMNPRRHPPHRPRERRRPSL